MSMIRAIQIILLGTFFITSFVAADNVPMIAMDALERGQPIIDPTMLIPDDTRKKYIIAWEGQRMDGAYLLVIHPSQMFVRSVHNQPKPNVILWVQDISEQQFHDIEQYLQKGKYSHLQAQEGLTYWSWRGYQVYHFTQSVPETGMDLSSDEQKQQQIKDSWATLYTNLNYLLRDINQHLLQDTPPVTAPHPEFTRQRKFVLIDESG